MLDPRTKRGIDPAQASAGIEVVKGQSETKLEHRGRPVVHNNGQTLDFTCRKRFTASSHCNKDRTDRKQPRESAIIRHAAVSNALDYVPRAKREISGARMKRYCVRLGSL